MTGMGKISERHVCPACSARPRSLKRLINHYRTSHYDRDELRIRREMKEPVLQWEILEIMGFPRT